MSGPRTPAEIRALQRQVLKEAAPQTLRALGITARASTLQMIEGHGPRWIARSAKRFSVAIRGPKGELRQITAIGGYSFDVEQGVRDALGDEVTVSVRALQDRP